MSYRKAGLVAVLATMFIMTTVAPGAAQRNEEIARPNPPRVDLGTGENNIPGTFDGTRHPGGGDLGDVSDFLRVEIRERVPLALAEVLDPESVDQELFVRSSSVDPTPDAGDAGDEADAGDEGCAKGVVQHAEAVAGAGERRVGVDGVG